tara:strand:- start:1773 stop:8972 length:7200 start_codon:yes stop_codon:yes gene_type:complete
MADIQDLRKLYPEFDEYGYTDSQVLDWVGGELGQDPMKLAEYYGLRDPDQGDFSRGISAGIDSTKALGYGLVGLAGDAVGVDAVRDVGIRGYQRNMDKVSLNARETDTVEGIDGVGDAVDFAQYYSGMAIPQVATALISGGVGGLVGKQVVKSAVKKKLGDGLEKEAKDLLATGAKRGGYAGVGTQAIGTELGATYGQAVEEAQANGESIDDINLGRVAGYGTLAGSLELVGDVATLGLARLGPASNLIDAARKTRTRGAVTGVASGSAVEGLTEGLQTGLEDMGAGRNLEEARFFDPTSVLAGAIGGGQLGAIGGLLRRPQQSGTDTNEVLEVAKDNVGEQLQLDLDDPSTPEQIQAAQEQAQQRAEVEAQQAKIAQDADNQVLRSEAQTFSRDDFKKQRTALLEQAVDNTETDLGKEFLEVINTPTEENPRGLIDVKDIKAARTSFVKAKAAEQDGTLNVEYEAELVNRVAKKAAVSNQGELDFKQATAVEKVQAELDKPALSGTKAIEQTERMFGKDWVNSGKYDDLAAAVNAPNFNRKKYAEALDKAVNPPAPAPVNTLAEDVADAAATLTAPEGLTAQQTRVFNVLADHFMGDKQYDIEKIYAGGKFLTTNIAKLAKVNDKTTAAKAITAFKTKLVENQGTVGRNTPKAEKDAAVQAVADKLAARVKEQRQEQLKGSQNQANASDAFDASVEEDTSNQTGVSIDRVKGTGKGADAALQSALKSMPEVDAPIQGTENRADADEALDNVEAMDMAELGVGGGFSTKASVGQGNYTGVAKEDQAFSKEQTTSDEEVAAVAEAQNAETRVADEAELTRLEPLTKQLWGNQTETDYDTLSVDQKIMWMRSAMEYAFTKDVDTINNDLNQVLEMDGQDQSGATNETSEPSDAGRNAQTEKRVPQKSTSSVSETESSGGNTDSPARKTDTASGTQETQQVGFEQVTPEEVKAKRPELTDEQAKNIAGVTNGARASMAEADRNRQENSPEDNEQFEPVVVEKKPAKKKLAKKAKQPTAKNRLMPSSFATGEAFVADANHGTTTDIVEFDNSRLGENTGAASAAEAFFFAAKGETASTYAENTSPRQKEAEFNKNFAVAKKWLAGKTLNDQDQKTLSAMLERSKELKNGAAFVSDLVDLSKKNPGATPVHARKMAQSLASAKRPQVQMRRIRMSNPLVKDFKGAKFRDETYVSLIKQAKAAGHDGVVLLNTYDVAGKRKEDLTEADMDTIFGVFDAKDITNTFKVREDNAKFGIPLAPEQRATRAAFEQEIKNLTGRTTNSRIHVFETEAEALQAIEDGAVPNMDIERLKKAKPYGWVALDDNGDPHSHFILDRVSAGREKSAFLHELGGHVGIDGIIPVGDQQDLVTQILDWSEQDGNALESQIARRAIGRVSAARVLDSEAMQSDAVILSETIAYFLEEAALAGVDPSVNSTVANFVAKLRDFFRAAYEKLGFGEAKTLTTQDIVDLAYGAARVELMHGVSEANVQNPMVTTSMNAARMGIVNREFVRDQLGGDASVKVFDTVVEVAAKAAGSVKFVHNIVRDNRESMPALGRWYDAMLKVETTRNEIKQSYQDIVKQARTLKSDRLTAVNNFLGDSTFDQQWGYDPKEYHPDLFAGRKVEVNSGKKTRFDRLSDSEKKIVADIFAHGERMRQRKVALAKKLGVAGKFFTDASLEGPYAPLKRFGNYAGELKSGRLIEAERVVKAEGATKKQKEYYEKLKSDRDHYVVSFFDTMGSAKQFVDQNKKNYAFSQASERAPNLESDRVSNPEVYEKVMGALAASNDASMDGGAKTAFREMVRGMYFQSMDERSARTSGAKRLNRAGYEQNMMRSFLSHANSEASLIAQMENGTEVNTAFAEAGTQTLVETGEGRDPAKQRAFNSIAGHYRNTLTRNETPLQDRISTMNSVYMLLTSVGYHLTNATQPIMVSVPRIAGDFGNYGDAWSAMFRGYKYSRAAAKIGLNMETEIDLGKVPQEYRGLLKLLQDRNLIDQGMEEDGSFNRFNTGFEVLNRASDVLGTITSKLYNVAKFVEAQNRISTAIAAYDAARANPTKLAAMKMTPEQYATAVVEDTQGNFSQLDAPLLIKSLPKVVTQYRKYQLLMAWHYSSAFKQIRWGSPEEKAAGARTLAYSLGHAAMGAGATGVPLLTTAFWLATFLGDEDEPQDMERWIKENIDDGAFGQALSRGVFSTFGLDLSTKLNQAKIFHPLPYVDFEAGEEGARNIIMGAVGPAGTTGVNFFRAAEYFKQGDLLKGIEYSTPKGIRSVAESYRLATEGMTTKSGTITVDPREFDVTSLLINAMGLPSSEINRLKWTKGQQYELEQYFNKEGGKIRKKYIEATRKRDRDGQAEMRQEFRDLQKAKDRVRPFFNDAPGALNRQSISTLLRAPRAKDRLERREQEKLR